MTFERLQITVQGQVQGVGFRPYVYNLAQTLSLTGWVQNTEAGVLIEIQGDHVSQFFDQVTKNLPPLAKIHHVQTQKIPLQNNEIDFKIIQSRKGINNTIISPDTCVCHSCLTELFDPNSRYYRYPFLNCTHCGPRLTITKILPYDRCHTAMDDFPLCYDCEIEYSNPNNRRYHAQPTACKNCGPQLSLSVNEISKSIMAGNIIALKGLGGYQLICDARNEDAIYKLRKRKNRESKPFALMVANIKSAKKIVEVDEISEQVLQSSRRPIVLLKKKLTLLPENIAPGLNHLGVMLPYTPLHYLLLNGSIGSPDGCQWLNEFNATILVVTSANLHGDPLIIDDEIASHELTAIADIIVSNNRQIVTRMDDSVTHIINKTPLLIRRARGFVPVPIKLPHAIPATLALGGDQKNTFCITRGDQAFVSQHIGSLNNKMTIDFFHQSLEYLLKFLAVSPERIAHDLHPNFYSTQFAENLKAPRFAIQHHHAHIASVAVEHGIQQPVLGLALDGYGYGLNGEAWGGELFLLEQMHFIRLGYFLPLPQPGGDIAAKEPWRMAAGVLHLLGRSDEIAKRFKEIPQAHLIQPILDKRINTPMTSSCGRLFDAVSALLGIQYYSQYEGQAAMRLESLVTNPQVIPDGWSIIDNKLNILKTIEYLLGITDPVTGANLFHGTLIAALSAWIKGNAREMGVDTILLSGGCFLNKILTEGLLKALNALQIKVLLPRDLPPNDGGISLGQAWIAGRL